MVAIPFAKVFIVGSRPEYVTYGIVPARRMVFEQGGQQSGGSLQDAVLQYVGCFRHVDTLMLKCISCRESIIPDNQTVYFSLVKQQPFQCCFNACLTHFYGVQIARFSQKCVILHPIVYLPTEVPSLFPNNFRLQVFQDKVVRFVYHRTVQ